MPFKLKLDTPNETTIAAINRRTKDSRRSIFSKIF
ncbi:MAG: hypothetical protein ACLUTO_07265 [Anaerostipes sp.]